MRRSLPSTHFRIDCGGPDRPRETAELVEPHVVGLEVREERLERHGAGDLGLLQPPVDVVEVDGAHRRQEVRAVDRGEAVAGHQAGNGNPRLLHGDLSRQPLAPVRRLALPEEKERHLRHRREVAAGADGALLADDGGHAPVQHLDERLRDDGPAGRSCRGRGR